MSLVSKLKDSGPGRVIRGLAADYGRLELGDRSAALTYFAMLAVFPGIIAMVALFGILGNDQTIEGLLHVIEELAPGDAAATFEGAVRGVVDSSAAGIALLVGLAAAIFSASGYIGAFMRAVNAIYDVDETRPFWQTIPLRLGLTVMLLVILGGTLGALVMTGPLAQAIGHQLGVSDSAISLWSYIRWPVIVVIVVCLFAALLYFGPNVDQPSFRALLPGSLLALALWLVASLAFSAYVANFGSYANTYGSLAGVVIFLLWIWISNVALLFGACFNVELAGERSRDDANPASSNES